jgi:hypothetical protein
MSFFLKIGLTEMKNLEVNNNSLPWVQNKGRKAGSQEKSLLNLWTNICIC